MDDASEAVLTASRALLGVVARSVAPALEQVSLPHFRVLVLLSREGPVRLGALAEELGVNASTFSRSTDRLVAAGWAVRAENPESRREVLLQLTDTGRELVASVTAARRREVAAVLERLDPAEREAVAAALAAFARAAGEPPAADLRVLGV